MSTVHHYKHADQEDHPPVTPTTYNYMLAEDRIQLTPVSIYEYEQQLNESRRTINLIDANQAPRIALELERLLND
jgi:hypothetical protein